MAKDDDFADTQDRLETLALKGKHGSGGGGGGGGDQKNRDFQISKALSLLLRHKAAEAGVELDSEGFANLDKVVSRYCPIAHGRDHGRLCQLHLHVD